MQGIEDLDATFRQILPDATAPPGFEQLLQTFVGK